MKIKLTNNEPLQINALINNTPKVIDVVSDIEDKQDALVSGTNIKTVNNQTLLGPGNIDVNEIESITTTESQASGGNNTITITETNGTTTTINIKNGLDGADGVSLGEIGLVQTTGDSEESVMSQKAVTDELLLDYSTNFRSLTWEGGLISSNNGANGTNGNYYRTRDYIEISNTTTGVVLNIDGTFDIMFYNSSGGYLGYRTITNNSVEITRATYPTLGRIRACCYKTYYRIKNLANTTVKASNYELLKSAIKQTTGQSEGSLMSQKAITDSIYRNIKVQNCSCGYLKPNTNHVINLTDAQYSRLNATDVASFRFILTEPENYASISMTLRYVGINGNNTNSSADNAFEFEWDYSKRMFARGKNYNTATCINKTSSGTIINPLVFTLVWDRTNGIIKYYERNTLISTQTYDEYKLDYFIAPSKSICFHGGDTGFYLYDVQIFDYDISKLFFATYENTLYGASMVFTKYANNFRNSTDNWVERNGNYSTYGGSFNGTIESTFPGDGTRVLTSTSNCTTSTYHTCGYYVGNSVQLQRWECDIEVVSGECAIRVGSASSSVITSIVDSNNNVYSGGDTLGVGNYTVKGVSGGTGVWYLYYRSGSMQVIYKKQRYKLISCVVHLKCDTFYDGFLYDDQAKHFYDQSNDLVPDNTPFTLPRTTTSNPPNYAGQMAVPSNGNIYIGTKNYTWKQINNS